MEQASQEAARCAVGSATDHPCPRVATEFVNRKDRPDWCWPHLFTARLRDTIAEAEQMLREREVELDDWLRSRHAGQSTDACNRPIGRGLYHGSRPFSEA
jgi:hypothetical protein